MKDSYGRTIDYLRISVTDQCNERCLYCMPEDNKNFLDTSSLLSDEEIVFIVKICAQKGIKKIRLTGGEPLLRKNIISIVKNLKKISGIEKVYITTNGLNLGTLSDNLIDAGLDGVNISLDAIDEELYKHITRPRIKGNHVEKIISAIEKLEKYSDFSVKINCVPMGINDNQIIPIAQLAQKYAIRVRYIELMPIGFAVNSEAEYRKNEIIFKLLEEKFGTLKPCEKDRYPYFSIEGFKGKIGFISPVSHSFCSECNRLRLTADGNIKACLEYKSAHMLKTILQSGMNENTARKISKIIDEEIAQKHQGNCFLHTTEKVQNSEENRFMNQIGG